MRLALQCSFRRIYDKRLNLPFNGVKNYRIFRKDHGSKISNKAEKKLVSNSKTKLPYLVEKKHAETSKLLPVNEYIKAPIKYVHLNSKKNVLYVNFGEIDELKFPIIWLRDNCRCHDCFDLITNSRIHPSLKFGDDIIPQSVKLSEDLITIIWEDQHISQYQKEWLCHHSFEFGHQIERLNKRHIQQKSWDAQEFLNIFPNICFKYDDIINDNGVLLKWLETLAVYGISSISEAPLEVGQVSRLARKVSYIRKTHYGEEYFIKNNIDASNVAYKKGELQMHTDLPYYHHVPGVVLLHFITQSSKGGENMLSDGLHIVKHLPKHIYNTLREILVDWVDIGCEDGFQFYSINRAPVLCENYMGNVERINWSQPQRDSVFNVTAENALQWYEAFQLFTKLLHDNKNAVTIKSIEGTILTFDNRRILHGRTDYIGERFLCGAYIDWDEIYSKIRVLRNSKTSK